MNKEYRVWIRYLIDKKVTVAVYVMNCDDINLAYAIAINKFINKITGKSIIIESVEVVDVTKRDSVYN